VIVAKPHFVFEGEPRRQLANAGLQLLALVDGMPIQSMEAVTDLFRGSRWLAMDTLARLSERADQPLDLSLDEAESLKGMLEIALRAHRLPWSSAPALAMAPLLKDLSNLEVRGDFLARPVVESYGRLAS
jgi:hypothetical protein